MSCPFAERKTTNKMLLAILAEKQWPTLECLINVQTQINVLRRENRTGINKHTGKDKRTGLILALFFKSRTCEVSTPTLYSTCNFVLIWIERSNFSKTLNIHVMFKISHPQHVQRYFKGPSTLNTYRTTQPGNLTRE